MCASGSHRADRLRLASLLQIHELKVVGSLSLCLGVAADILTAAALCFFLRNLRTGYSKCVEISREKHDGDELCVVPEMIPWSTH